MSMITVYSLPNCPNCVNTKRFMNRQNVSYTEDELTVDSADRLGYRTAPVVTETIDGEESVLWAGGLNVDGIIDLSRRARVSA